MKSDPNKAAKLRDLADKCEAEAQSKFQPSTQNMTPKRSREAQSRRIDGARLERAASALRCMADLLEAGTLPDILSKSLSKAAVLSAVAKRIGSKGYYDVYEEDTFIMSDPVSALIQSYTAKAVSPEVARKRALDEKVAALALTSIPGFFPTPLTLIYWMLDKANERSRGFAKIYLEPSAGHGAIADAIKATYPESTVDCFERHHTLREILELKGHNLIGYDFTDFNMVGTKYDAVIMNPPFEKGQDMEHVLHAFNFLKPGGVLVAIMAAGVTFNNSKAHEQFRKWVSEHGGDIRNLPDGTFNKPGQLIRTGVSTVMLTITK